MYKIVKFNRDTKAWESTNLNQLSKDKAISLTTKLNKDTTDLSLYFYNYEKE